jgi:tellurite resistance protein
MLDNEPRRMIVRLAVAVMAADGRITPNEIAGLERLEERGLGPLRSLVGSEIERAARMPIDLAETCRVLETGTPQARALAFAAAAEIAAADGIDDGERRLLVAIAPMLGVPDDVVADVLRTATEEPRHVPPAPPASAARRAEDAPPPRMASASGGAESPCARARALLGVAPDASAADIDAAYRRVVERYDPAGVFELGPEFAVLAVRRLAAATAAYELARSGAEGV